MPMNLKVERRYSDFEWLKEKLNFLYSGSPIPPISRKGQFRRYDDKHLTKRQIILEMFLNKLVSIPELKS
jgi:DNA-binding transcriptional MerR regulator